MPAKSRGKCLKNGRKQPFQTSYWRQRASASNLQPVARGQVSAPCKGSVSLGFWTCGTLSHMSSGQRPCDKSVGFCKVAHEQDHLEQSATVRNVTWRFDLGMFHCDWIDAIDGHDATDQSNRLCHGLP